MNIINLERTPPGYGPEVGTGSQNHMTYGAWNANYSTSWQFLAGVCWAVSRDLGTSGQVRWDI